MLKDNLEKLLIISIIFNLIFGGVLFKKNWDNKKQTELTFYNYCRSISYVYEDLDYKLFKSAAADLNNKEYVRTTISNCTERFSHISKMMRELVEKDKRIDKITGIDMNYPVTTYLWSLSDKVNKNKALDEKDITTLKEIIAKGKQFYSFVDSAPNYNSKYDPETPLDKIAKMNNEINKLCEDSKNLNKK